MHSVTNPEPCPHNTEGLGSQIRELAASVIASDPVFYTAVLLEKAPAEYVVRCLFSTKIVLLPVLFGFTH